MGLSKKELSKLLTGPHAETKKKASRVLTELHQHLCSPGGREQCRDTPEPLMVANECDVVLWLSDVLKKHSKDSSLIGEVFDCFEIMFNWYGGSPTETAMKEFLDLNIATIPQQKALLDDEDQFGPYVETLYQIFCTDFNHSACSHDRPGTEKLVIAVKNHCTANMDDLLNIDLDSMCETILERLSGKGPVLSVKSIYEAVLLCSQENGSAAIHGHPEMRRMLTHVRDEMESLVKDKALNDNMDNPMDSPALRNWIYGNLTLQTFCRSPENCSIMQRKNVLKLLIATLTDKHCSPWAKQHSLLTISECVRVEDMFNEKFALDHRREKPNYVQTLIDSPGIYATCRQLTVEGRDESKGMSSREKELWLFPRIEIFALLIQHQKGGVDTTNAAREMLHEWDSLNPHKYKNVSDLHTNLDHYASLESKCIRKTHNDDHRSSCKDLYKEVSKDKSIPAGMVEIQKETGLVLCPLDLRTGFAVYQGIFDGYYYDHHDAKRLRKELYDEQKSQIKKGEEAEGGLAARRKSVIFQNGKQSTLSSHGRKSINASMIAQDLENSAKNANTVDVKDTRKSFFTQRELVESNKVSKSRKNLGLEPKNDFERRKSMAMVENQFVVTNSGLINTEVTDLLKYVLAFICECIAGCDPAHRKELLDLFIKDRTVYYAVGQFADPDSSPKTKTQAARFIFLYLTLSKQVAVEKNDMSLFKNAQRDIYKTKFPSLCGKMWMRAYNWDAPDIEGLLCWSAVAITLMVDNNMKVSAELYEDHVTDIIAPMLRHRSKCNDWKSVNAFCLLVRNLCFHNDLMRNALAEQWVCEAFVGVLARYQFVTGDNYRNKAFGSYHEALGNLILGDDQLKRFLGVGKYARNDRHVTDKYKSLHDYYCTSSLWTLQDAFVQFMLGADSTVDEHTLSSTFATIRNISVDRRYLGLFGPLMLQCLQFFRREQSRSEAIHGYILTAIGNIVQDDNNARQFVDNDGIATVMTTLPFLTDKKARALYPQNVDKWTVLENGYVCPQHYIVSNVAYLFGQLAVHPHATRELANPKNNVFKLFSDYLLVYKCISDDNRTHYNPKKDKHGKSPEIGDHHKQLEFDAWGTQVPLSIMRALGNMLTDDVSVDQAVSHGLIQNLCISWPEFDQQPMLCYEASRLVCRALAVKISGHHHGIKNIKDKDIDGMVKYTEKNSKLDEKTIKKYHDAEQYIAKEDLAFKHSNIKQVKKECGDVIPWFLFDHDIKHDPKLDLIALDAIKAHTSEPAKLIKTAKAIGIGQTEMKNIIYEIRLTLGHPGYVRMRKTHEYSMTLLSFFALSFDKFAHKCLIERIDRKVHQGPQKSRMAASRREIVENHNYSGLTSAAEHDTTTSTVSTPHHHRRKIAKEEGDHLHGVLYLLDTDRDGHVLDKEGHHKIRVNLWKEMLKAGDNDYMDRFVLGNGTLPVDDASIICIMFNQMYHLDYDIVVNRAILNILQCLLVSTAGDPKAFTLVAFLDMYLALSLAVKRHCSALALMEEEKGLDSKNIQESIDRDFNLNRKYYSEMMLTYGLPNKDTLHSLLNTTFKDRFPDFVGNVATIGHRRPLYPGGVYEINNNPDLENAKVYKHIEGDLVSYLRKGVVTKTYHPNSKNKCYMKWSAKQDLRYVQWFYVDEENKDHLRLRSDLDWDIYGKPYAFSITAIQSVGKEGHNDLEIRIPPVQGLKHEGGSFIFRMIFDNKKERDDHYTIFNTWRMLVGYAIQSPSGRYH